MTQFSKNVPKNYFGPYLTQKKAAFHNSRNRLFPRHDFHRIIKKKNLIFEKTNGLKSCTTPLLATNIMQSIRKNNEPVYFYLTAMPAFHHYFISSQK